MIVGDGVWECNAEQSLHPWGSHDIRFRIASCHPVIDATTIVPGETKLENRNYQIKASMLWNTLMELQIPKEK